MTSDWDALGPRFVDEHYGSLRGRVRTGVIDAHLREHLAPPPLEIVDVGGGAGNQSIPLARSGYDVTILDPSEVMLAQAEDRLRGETRETVGRVTLVHARGEDAVAELGPGRFSAVLCHGVVMYLEQPAPMLDALCGLAGHGGVVSIVAKNVEAMAMRPAHEGDWAAVLDAFDATHQVNGLGVTTRGDRIGAMSAELTARRVDTERWYGVRLFTDGWQPGRAPDDREDLVLAAELEASRRDPYRRLSRLFHLVGRKR